MTQQLPWGTPLLSHTESHGAGFLYQRNDIRNGSYIREEFLACFVSQGPLSVLVTMCNPWWSVPRTPWICVFIHLDGNKGKMEFESGLVRTFHARPPPPPMTLLQLPQLVLSSYSTLHFALYQHHHAGGFLVQTMLPFCFYPPTSPSLGNSDLSFMTSLNIHLF